MFKNIKEYFIEKKHYKTVIKLAYYQIAVKTQELMELEVENKKLENDVLEKTNSIYNALDLEKTNDLMKMLSDLMSEIRTSK
jgi:hypothetical protein